MDDVLKNPTREQIASILSASEQGAAKWLKDPDIGNIYYWPAESHQHMEVAYWLQLRGYTKGIVLQDGSDAPSQDRQPWQTDLDR